MRWWSVVSGIVAQKTEPSINLEQTTPCTRAPAQNLLIRSVSLTTHETKMIEYKYFSCSFCLLCLDPSTVREKWLIKQRTMVRSNQLDTSIYQNTCAYLEFLMYKVWFDLIWLDSIWFDQIRFVIGCNAMRCDDEVLFRMDHNFSRCRKKTEPSINLEQTTPCTRAPAQNLLIRSVSLTTHETKMIEYKYFSCSFCLLCLDHFYCQREMIDKSMNNGEIKSIGRVNLSKHMRLPWILDVYGLVWFDLIGFNLIWSNSIL